MLSARLIEIVTTHRREIADRVVRRMRRASGALELGRLPEADLRERVEDIITSLPSWLAVPGQETAGRYEQLGRRRFEEGVPLHELVYALQSIKANIISYVRDQGLARGALELYAEEEFEHGVGRVFDRIVYLVVRGYERALRAGAHAVA
jgi:hypothetical protein